MSSQEDRPTQPFEPEGRDDAALDRAGLEGLLAALPREEVSPGFTDAVLSRIGKAEETEKDSLSLIDRAGKLLFGSHRSYLSLLAASAAVALALGLGWANSRTDSSSPAPVTVAGSGAASAQGGIDQGSMPEVDTFRGQPVTTTPTRSSAPPMTARPTVRPKTERELEIQALRDDYARLQRELMILQQLAAEGSPMIEVGSNGQVDFYIDLGEFIQTPAASPSSTGAQPVTNEGHEPEQF